MFLFYFYFVGHLSAWLASKVAWPSVLFGTKSSSQKTDTFSNLPSQSYSIDNFFFPNFFLQFSLPIFTFFWISCQLTRVAMPMVVTPLLGWGRIVLGQKIPLPKPTLSNLASQSYSIDDLSKNCVRFFFSQLFFGNF